MWLGGPVVEKFSRIFSRVKPVVFGAEGRRETLKMRWQADFKSVRCRRMPGAGGEDWEEADGCGLMSIGLVGRNGE
jgi:hypothetical protein